MTRPEGRIKALERAKALRKLDRFALKSFQYDIEPYLRNDYRADPARVWQEWAETISALSKTLGRKIDVVVPFWMLGDVSGHSALSSAQSSISRVSIMAYRTDVAAIEDIASDWLDWSAQSGIPVAVALENGPLLPEIHRTYVKSPHGELLLNHSGAIANATLTRTEGSASAHVAAYRFSHAIEVDNGRISFLGNKSDLKIVIDRLQKNLSAWSGFEGLFVHEFIKIRQ